MHRFWDLACRLGLGFLPKAIAWQAALGVLGWLFLALALGLFLAARQRSARRLMVLAGAFLCAAVLALGLFWGVPRFVGPARFAVLQAMQERPQDPWPRGTGHAILAPYGALESHKGYLEPGGSFSPEPKSFGVSFWIMDKNDQLVATSENIPLNDTEQRYEEDAKTGPSVTVQTPFYRAIWRAEGAGSYRLSFRPAESAKDLRFLIVLRGVGPAGGPLTHLERRGEVLRLGNDWTLQGVSREADVVFLDESKPSRRFAKDHLESPTGWAQARLSVPKEGGDYLLQGPTFPLPEQAPPPAHEARVTGGDPRFDAALAAQATTLRLGLVGDETRPGDPYNYPLAWQRDGAYVVVALARAGDLERAKKLARLFAQQDFFGGFGAEADAPGLGLWVLGEVSRLARDPAFDAFLAEPIRRKVAILRDLRRLTAPRYASYQGPLVPAHRAQAAEARLVADPALQGLIVGRMDWHRPLFYVNAVAYLGLKEASAWAVRAHDAELAALCDTEADALQRAWRKAFLDPAFQSDRANDRTAISGLWPSNIADGDAFRLLMQEREKASAGKPPSASPWTYFTVAEAHQWLRLGQAEKSWRALEDLWQHQPVPGLYTMWEGTGEENSFGLWPHVRGWVKPPSVTPHYWSAAEMALLLLDMMATIEPDEAGSETLALGAGVRPAWLTQPFSAENIGTARGFVDWSFDPQNGVRVHQKGFCIPVRLGAAFPSTTRVQRSCAPL